MELEEYIEKILKETGIERQLSGYFYLKMAIALCPNQVWKLNMSTIYSKIAEKIGIGAAAIERGMRYAIQKAVNVKGAEFLFEYFGREPVKRKRIMTNSIFLWLCIEKIEGMRKGEKLHVK